MKRRLPAAASALSIAALLAVAAAPSSANVPTGNGLVDFGVFNCEGVGEVSVFGPMGPNAAASFTTTGQKVVLLSLSVTATDTEGNPVVDFTKTYGQKSGLTAITCTQHFEDGGLIGDAIAVVALVPPQ